MKNYLSDFLMFFRSTVEFECEVFKHGEMMIVNGVAAREPYDATDRNY